MMPYSPPHLLLPWLVEQGLFPDHSRACVKCYWRHLQKCNSPLARISPSMDHIPIWIWGDGARYNAKGDNVIAMCFGSVLDVETKSSVHKCFPLALCREDASRDVDML